MFAWFVVSSSCSSSSSFLPLLLLLPPPPSISRFLRLLLSNFIIFVLVFLLILVSSISPCSVPSYTRSSASPDPYFLSLCSFPLFILAFRLPKPLLSLFLPPVFVELLLLLPNLPFSCDPVHTKVEVRRERDIEEDREKERDRERQRDRDRYQESSNDLCLLLKSCNCELSGACVVSPNVSLGKFVNFVKCFICLCLTPPPQTNMRCSPRLINKNDGHPLKIGSTNYLLLYAY